VFRVTAFSVLLVVLDMTQTGHSQEQTMNEPTLPSIQVIKSDRTVKGWFYKLEPVRDDCTELYEEEFIPGADTPVGRSKPFDPECYAVGWPDDDLPLKKPNRSTILYVCPRRKRGLTPDNVGYCRYDFVMDHISIQIRGGYGDWGYATSDFYKDYDFMYEDLGRSSVVISRRLADALKTSGLKGFGLGTTEIINPPKGAPKDLAVLQFRGRFCQRQRVIVGAPNACPLCGYKPLVCPDCGEYPSLCPKCDGITDVLPKEHQGPNDRRFLRGRESVARVLDGRLWDGSDFIYGRFISRRALNFLQSIKATRYAAIPVELDLEGVDEKQLTLLQAAGVIEAGTASATKGAQQK
jgi:hypothetical protein